jgi:hypothetical protein
MIPDVLPSFKCPAIFDISGGTRLFCVLGGPGQRAEVERAHGKHDQLSSNTIVDQPSAVLTSQVVAKVCEALPGIFTTQSYFTGASIDFVPHVWHDGAPKSEMSYHMFKQLAMFKHVDKMQGLVGEPSLDVFWAQALNRTDTKTLTTQILFCSNESLGRIVRGCNLVTPDARLYVPSGGIVMFNIPIQAQAGMAVACGPFSHHGLHWGSVTAEEYQAIHRPINIPIQAQAGMGVSCGPFSHHAPGCGGGGAGTGGGGGGSAGDSAVKTTTAGGAMTVDGGAGSGWPVDVAEVLSALATCTECTWSSDLLEEANVVFEELGDAAARRSAWEAALVKLRPSLFLILRDFVKSPSFKKDQESHRMVERMMGTFATPTP